MITGSGPDDPPPPVETEPSAIKYCDNVPPDLTNDVAVTVPLTSRVVVGDVELIPILSFTISVAINELDVRFAFCLFFPI